MIASADFTFCEFYAVVYDPADRGVCQAGGAGVFLSPGHHSLRGVYMGHAGACPGGCQCGPASVGEEIEYLHRPSRGADLFPEPVPVCGLLWKQAGMLKAEGF